MRLTEKNEFGYILHIKPVDNSLGNEIAIVGETANKLGQLEDIEEELGIGLITLWKAYIKGFYNIDKLNGNIVWCPPSSVSISFGRDNIYIECGCFEDLISNYGKTWALTKEELL